MGERFRSMAHPTHSMLARETKYTVPRPTFPRRYLPEHGSRGISGP